MALAGIDSVIQRALACGALAPIETRLFLHRDDLLDFAIYQVSSLERKQKDGERRRREKTKIGLDFNPFLPYDERLFVTDFAPDYVGLLNKFPVLERHLLLVTRQFEAQTSLLDRLAFQVLFQAMSQLPGLGFYNGGIGAGASQAHKHLQLVPLKSSDLPIRPLLEGAASGKRTLVFPFDHYFQKLNQASPEEAFEAYRQGMTSLGMWGTEGQQLCDYNLLCTQQWLLLVPRSRENFQGISVNALGFAGSLLVRNQAEMELIKRIGPMNLLAHVART